MKYFIHIVLVLSLLPFLALGQATCGSNIIRGCTGAACPLLDPNGDGRIASNGTGFTNCAVQVNYEEMAQFEDLRNASGCSSCQRPWTAINQFEPVGDLWAGGSSCSNTDILSWGPSQPYAYMTVVDPDGTCNNGDELLIFRARVSSSVNGSFSYSIVIDTDLRLGSEDPHGIQCANKISNGGFEYEILADPSNSGGVSVRNIDGLVGSFVSVVSYPNSTHYNQARGCRTVCSCAGGAPTCCNGGASSPVYHTFAIRLTDIGKSCNDMQFRYSMFTASSGNGTVSSNTSVSDVGGIGSEPTCAAGTVPCNCCEDCSTPSSSFFCGTGSDSTNMCLTACITACLANGGGIIFPVKYFDTHVEILNGVAVIGWTAESYHLKEYVLQRANPDNEAFKAENMIFTDLHVIAANAYDFMRYSYKTLDYEPRRGINVYRLKSVDYDGTVAYSPLMTLNYDPGPLEKFSVFPTQTSNGLINVQGAGGEVRVADLSGRLVIDTRVTDAGATLDLSREPDGVYSLAVYSGTQARFFKVVKTANGF